MIDTILISQKIRIYPNKTQIHAIESTFGATRKMYNCLHAQAIERLNRSPDDRNNHKYKNYTAIKNDWNNTDDWLKLIPMQALAHVELAYKQAWRNTKRNKNKAGYPKFKSKHKSRLSYSLTNNSVKNDIDVTDSLNWLKIPKLGKIKLSNKIRFKNYKIQKVTISKSVSNKYFVAINMHVPKYELKSKKLRKTKKAIGLDVGLTHFLADSDGQKINNPRYLRKYEEKLSKEQRILSRKILLAKAKNKKLADCKNIQKQRLKVNKIHEKITNSRKNFLHKLSHTIINESQIVIVEDLKISNMLKNKKSAKSISDVSWSEFFNQLKYKCEINERQFVKIDTFFPSTKMCSNCKMIDSQDKDLSVRDWVCENCNTHHDRDINAAINIRNEGLRLLV